VAERAPLTQRPADSIEAETAAWDAVKPVPARSAHQLGFLAGVEWAEDHGDASMVRWFNEAHSEALASIEDKDGSVCDCCGESPATHCDRDGVPLCDGCEDALVDSIIAEDSEG